MSQILLVEPDAVLAKTYGQALMQAGHTVMWCITAHQAVIAADTVMPDLVILEPQLAEHGGVEFLYEFRSYPEWDAVPIYIFSRQAPEEYALNRQMRSHLGIYGYWQKSRLTLKTFVTVVTKALEAQTGVPTR